ncbi:multidrug effflux MFS transporter [Nocardiopsis lambiniae]|uniref:Multidrug effflux MFS transporter n=1 Tax=Nocardiopsis lambiniae TaxID=3075539 RepID=A0ABU2M6K3_9ACTN|nr:multidrug effflux MFS transporter [Nocardiopsis sp. DSM 44743]MDT0328298.1 multidrug effflux MFS transporter [Nocardiopsis sp. DSM 44743]
MTLASVRPDRRHAATPTLPTTPSVPAPPPRSTPPTAGPGRARALLLIVVLGALSAIGPLATDLYLPALPEIAADLNTSESAVKLTLTSVMAGMALGQLVVGPLSDRWGRRGPLLVGTIVFTLSTGAIAFAPNVEVFTVLRFVQGLSAAAGLVVSRAIVRDVFDGDAAATFFSRLVLLSGLAPMLGPILGGQLLVIGPWPLLFGVLGAAGLLTTVLVWWALPESLPVERRTAVDPRGQLRVFGALLRDVRFIVPTMTLALSFGMSFTYISAFSFVSRNELGADARQFALVFAVTTLGMIVGNQINAMLIRRVEIHRRLILGLAGSIASVVALGVLDVSGSASLLSVTVALFVMMLFTGLVSPNATALALAGQPSRTAGSGSALLGTLQFGIGSAVAALAGLGGSVTLSGMTAVMLTAAVGAASVFALAAVPARRARAATV